MDASLAYLTSLEELITNLTKQELVPTCVVDALWEVFGEWHSRRHLSLLMVDLHAIGSKRAQITTSHRTGALMLMSMMANANPTLITSHLHMVHIGLCALGST